MEFAVGIWFVVSVFDLIYMLDVIVDALETARLNAKLKDLNVKIRLGRCSDIIVLTLCCLVPLVHLVFAYTFITKQKAIRNIFRSTFISAVNEKIT